MLNRGDRYTIAVKEGRELNNPLSGTVVDLCPVGALTHRHWRFNTRIWYANPTPSICPGCSTGCNVIAYERDGEVVQVKARLNADVNQEWLCDEGRYGFHRFLPKARVTAPARAGAEVPEADGFAAFAPLRNGNTLLLLAPDLTVEEYAVAQAFAERCLERSTRVVALRTRALTEVERVLVSPDYAANFRGAAFVDGLGGEGSREALEARYLREIARIKANEFDNILFIGDWSLAEQELGDSIGRASCRERV